MTVIATDLRYSKADRMLHVGFYDGTSASLPAEYLRVESPSAEVQGHGPNERRWVAGKRSVGITGLEPVGHYAIRILFDDGHDTGIFSWEYLHKLGREQDRIWRDYLSALQANGLSRDR